MDSSSTTPITTDTSSQRVPETAQATPTPNLPIQLSPEEVELAQTKNLLQQSKVRFNQFRVYMHANMQRVLRELHNTRLSLQAETAGRLNVQQQFNDWHESAREAFAVQRANLANAEQRIKDQEAELANAKLTIEDQEAALLNAEQTMENLREMLEDCTCKCKCEEHANQAECKHFEKVKELREKLEYFNCSVCMQVEADTLWPCGHVASCTRCAHNVSATDNLPEGEARCPICREKGRFKKIHFA